MGNGIESLAHTKWRCLYHVVLYQSIGEKRYTEYIVRK